MSIGKVIFTDLEPDDILGIILILENATNEDNIIFYLSYGNFNEKKKILEKILECYKLKNIEIFIDDKIEPKLNSGLYDILIITNPELCCKCFGLFKNKMRNVIISGGHYKNICSYNWSNDIDSTIKFFEQLSEININKCVLFSSHMFAERYNGYYNSDKFPKVIDKIFGSKKKQFEILCENVKQWDENIIKKYPEIIKRISEKNIGKQFAPMDVVTSLYFIGFDIGAILQKYALKIKKESNECELSETAVNNVTYNPIFVVDNINIEKINDFIIECAEK
jgi:hypothetical protein